MAAQTLFSIGSALLNHSSRTAVTRLRNVNLGVAARSFAVSSLEYTVNSYIVSTVVDLWEDKVGEVDDDYELALEVIIPILMASGRSKLTANLFKRKTNGAMPYPPNVRRDVINMPILSGVSDSIVNQAGVKSYGIIRDVARNSISVTNSFGNRVFTIDRNSFSLSSRVSNGIVRNKGKAALAAIAISGGTAEGYAALFSEQSLLDTASDYLGLLAQALETEAGIDLTDVPFVTDIDIGGRIYEDIGELHKEILTNTRSVLSDIMQSLNVDADVADDIVSRLLVKGAEYARSLSIKIGEIDTKSIPSLSDLSDNDVDVLMNDLVTPDDESFEGSHDVFNESERSGDTDNSVKSTVSDTFNSAASDVSDNVSNNRNRFNSTLGIG